MYRSAFAVPLLASAAKHVQAFACAPRRSIGGKVGEMRGPVKPVGGLSFLSAKEAAQLDEVLMSDEVGYTLDQLMELAGQAVAHGVDELFPMGHVYVAVGPGNNGGDGLVAARHLVQLGREATVMIPRPSKGRFPKLERLCEVHGVGIIEDTIVRPDAGVVVDCVFGFSFRPRGSEGVSGALADLVRAIDECEAPVVSVDVPRLVFHGLRYRMRETDAVVADGMLMREMFMNV